MVSDLLAYHDPVRPVGLSGFLICISVCGLSLLVSCKLNVFLRRLFKWRTFTLLLIKNASMNKIVRLCSLDFHHLHISHIAQCAICFIWTSQSFKADEHRDCDRQILLTQLQWRSGGRQIIYSSRMLMINHSMFTGAWYFWVADQRRCGMGLYKINDYM